MSAYLALVSVLISGCALGVSGVSALFARRQLRLAEQQRERDFEATVVCELESFARRPEGLRYVLRVTNAGPAVARAVDVELTEWNDSGPLGISLDSVTVAPALIRGEQRMVTLNLDAEHLPKLDEPNIAIEVMASYFDDNGSRNHRLAFVYDGELLLAPPGPPLPR